MEKTYDPHAIEQHWYQTWESNDYFTPNPAERPYCIMIPPPNVTGTLHMGHAFQDSLMDILTRYYRMQGHETLWQVGTDHAGIATQMVVERRLALEGKKRHDLGREAFIEKVWEWKGQSGGTITRQLRRMGASVDWAHERFTMDDGLSHAVKTVFVRLYEEGLIYRGKRLVNWDPVLHTAVSDLEVESQEENGHLWHLRYPLAAGNESVIVATTRPETMLGDTAVAVHPDDERYQHLIGQHILLPLTQRKIPVIADHYVDPEFGSGCVKITPAHDFNDYAVGQRHNLPKINVFSIEANILADFQIFTAAGESSEPAPAAYRGLDRYAARKQIVKDLDAAGLLVEAKPHRLMVPRGDRSHAVIEPFLTDQWYVKVAPLAEPAIQAVEDGRIKFIPENWSKTYFEWMRNIEDWCISRQIWWGHRIPAWYDAQGQEYVGYDEAHVREKYQLAADVHLKQDDDVLDTWFSSALWPFSTLGFPEQTERLQRFYPTNVLVTGFDIIFFWVARMIMMGLKFMGDVPFKEVYVTGLIRDSEGQKMSKSKGNVLDPIDLVDGIDLAHLVQKQTTGLMQPEMAPKIEKFTRQHFPDGIPAFGTDALRFTLAALASTGRDIRFDLGRIEGYRNFCNKLWNATRYVLMNTEGQDTGVENPAVELSLPDRWIISHLQEVEAELQTQLQAYRFDLAAHTVYEFTWNEYCDWYLEFSKPVLQDANSSELAQRGTRRTLVRVLEALLRLLHPFMPFITEELWQRVAPLAGRSGETIMLQPFPQPQTEKIDAEALAEIAWVKQFILGVRRIRAEMDIAPSKLLPVLLQKGDADDRAKLDKHELLLSSLAKLEHITWLAADATAPQSALALVGEMQILIPLAGLIDKDAELNRLNKEIEKLSKDLAKSTSKLDNPKFIDRAPVEIVEKEKARVAEMQASLRQLGEQVEKIRLI